MGTVNVQQAAQQASNQSGIRSDVLAAMIQLEGPSQSAPNNPFDVTQTWANLTGLGASVAGIFNSVGVAIFSNEPDAIAAWWRGLSSFSNYADLRKVIATPGSTVSDFYNALAKTGYAGNSSTYGSSLNSLYQSMTGNDPGKTLLSGGGTGPTFIPGVDPSQQDSSGNITSPTIDTSGIGASVASALGGVGNAASSVPDALANATRAIAAIPVTLGNGLDELKNLGAFFQQPDLWIRVLMVIGGAILTVIGLILVALSFVKPGSVRVPVVG